MLTASATMVETCLLLPGAVSAEKPAARSRGPARCLFGPAAPGEVELLLREQLAADRERLLWRFGFDVVSALAGQELRATKEACTPDPVEPLPAAPVPAVRRPRSTPYHRQTTVKDFYRVHKAPAEKKLGCVSRPADPASAQAAVD